MEMKNKLVEMVSRISTPKDVSVSKRESTPIVQQSSKGKGKERVVDQSPKRVFEKCRRFGISLNPKKSNFGMEEGKLFGHIISKEGIKIDPNRVDAILKIDIPRRKKEVQSFLGRVNFLRRFIPNLAEFP